MVVSWSPLAAVSIDFSVDPGDLLDDEAPQDADSTEGPVSPEADREGK
ncbi:MULTISPECIES: hypothetical protein [unclassified Micromonospora]|nr:MULTISPECIES: hypothetical protein [unclassified Micromonospora]MCZ7420357.1 hypothetical protein [Verrucosispora sp. WMMA2121]WBB89144.1 hypothetical protein O7597_19185 [Verrucosispora sp. WMMC514]